MKYSCFVTYISTTSNLYRWSVSQYGSFIEFNEPRPNSRKLILKENHKSYHLQKGPKRNILPRLHRVVILPVIVVLDSEYLIRDFILPFIAVLQVVDSLFFCSWYHSHYCYNYLKIMFVKSCIYIFRISLDLSYWSIKATIIEIWNIYRFLVSFDHLINVWSPFTLIIWHENNVVTGHILEWQIMRAVWIKRGIFW